MGEPAIVANGLSRSFGAVAALVDLNLSIPPGMVYGLIGPNGAGKTTTLRLLLGLLRPSAGSALVLGCDPLAQGHHVRSRTGTVLESCGLYERLSAWENLDYFARIWHMPLPDRHRRAQELMEQVGLWDHRHEVIDGWSHGLKQRLCVARSLLHRPALLLFDEPAADVDAEEVQENSAYLCNLSASTGLTVFMATSNPALAESCCDSVTLLQRGRVLACGRTGQIACQGAEPSVEISGRGFTDEVVTLLLRRPEVASVELTDHGLVLQLTARVDTAPLVSLLVESGVAVTEVKKREASLRSAVENLLQKDGLEASFR